MTTLTIAKWGNSDAVRLPKALLEELQLSTGTELEVVRQDDGFFFKKKMSRLDEMLSNVGDLYVDEEWDNMEPVGPEIIDDDYS